MTLLVPEYLQTQDYDAIKDRYLLQGVLGAGGVGGAGDYLVSQRAAGGAGAFVDVAAGRAWVLGTDTARQGIYHEVNDGVITFAIVPPDGTNPRVDRLVLHIYDSTVIGGIRDEAALEWVAGTATSGATLANLNGMNGVLPASSLELAKVLVPTTGVISNANIADARTLIQQVGPAKTVTFLAALAANAIWTNIPATLTEAFGQNTRQQHDLTAAAQARLTAHVTTAASASAELRAQYTTDLTGATGWTYLDGGTGPAINIATTGNKASSWATIAQAARADVLLRVIGINGDGAADPAIPRLALQLR